VVTAAAGAEQVRFVAPSSVYQMRLEVFADGDTKVFDSGFTPGNVLDWDLGTENAQPLAEGAVVCVVTVRDISGRLEKRAGVLSRRGGASTWLAPDGAAEAEGAGADIELVAAARSGAGLATTLLAHDERGGVLASGGGGLSFRVGDFLAGQDLERMRLTAQGNLGVGISTPRARLDVGGEIRTSAGIRFPDGSLQTTAATGSGPLAVGGESLTPVSAALGGTGTANAIARWTSGTDIGNSSIVDVGGNIGVGTAAPGAAFDLQRASSGDVLQRFWNTGAGGAKLRYVAGNGATSQLQMTDIDEWLAAIAVHQTKGLELRVRGTDPSDNTEAGLAASTRLTISRQGYVGIGTNDPFTALDVKGGSLGGGGDLGEVHIGGFGLNGDPKLVTFGNTRECDPGCVFIGELAFDDLMVLRAGEFRFAVGDLTPNEDGAQSLGTAFNRWSDVWAANGTIQTSDARLKQAVTDLPYGLPEVLRLRPVTYEWKDRADGRRHLGLIAQEVQRVLPEAVVASADPASMLGMNYADLLPVVIKAIQQQQDGIAALAAENGSLRARLAALEHGSTEEGRTATQAGPHAPDRPQAP
jgi:hypothetical protein